MKHLALSELQSYLKDLPEGEVFAVHDEVQKTSLYVLTPSGIPEQVFAFGCKIKGQLYTSAWVGESQDKAIAKDAMKQILFIKKLGWYATDETALDDIKMFREPLYRCAYCGAETTSPKGACACLA